jgi:elongation factor G
MKLEIVVPEEYLGDTIADVGSRRGAVHGTDTRGNVQVVQATVPLAETFGYATDLRSLTQGRATYSMEFSHYQQVPAQAVEEITRHVVGAPTVV